jgi:hypothetical protein
VNNPADWKTAHERIAGIIQASNAYKKGLMKIGIGLAGANPTFERISKYFPDRSSYDFIGVDIYDRYAISNSPSNFSVSFDYKFSYADAQIYQQIKNVSDAPIFICESATGRFTAANTLKTKYNGVEWVKKTLSALTHKYTDIMGYIYFAELATSWQLSDANVLELKPYFNQYLNGTIPDYSTPRAKKNLITKDTSLMANWLQGGTAQGVLTSTTTTAITDIVDDNSSKNTRVLRLTNPTQTTAFDGNMQNYIYFVESTSTLYQANVAHILQFSAWSNNPDVDITVCLLDDSAPTTANLRGTMSFRINQNPTEYAIGLTTGIVPANFRICFGIGKNAVGTEVYLDCENIKLTKGDEPPVFGNLPTATPSSNTQTTQFKSFTAVSSPSTTTETTLFSTVSATGSLVIPANTLAINDVYEIEIIGRYTTSATPPAVNLRLKLGAAIILNPDPVAFTLPASRTDQLFTLKYLVRITGLGTIGSGGLFQADLLRTDGVTIPFKPTIAGSDVLDTTISNTWDFTSQWSTAPTTDTIQIRNVIISKK